MGEICFLCLARLFHLQCAYFPPFMTTRRIGYGWKNSLKGRSKPATRQTAVSRRDMSPYTSTRFSQAAGRAFCSTKQTIMQASTPLAAGGSQNFFRLDITALPQWTSLSSLYDLVRVRKVKLSFVPQFNVHDVQASTNASLPLFHSAIDHAGIAAGGKATSALQEYSNYRFDVFDKTLVRSFVPAFPNAITGSGQQPQYCQWMSTEAMNSSVLGAGLYWNTDALQSGQGNGYFTILIEVFLEFKAMN